VHIDIFMVLGEQVGENRSNLQFACLVSKEDSDKDKFLFYNPLLQSLRHFKPFYFI
jgi:tRNA isopentenyl-2-thiomethyl-A-37 hydroxylase MiaE